MSLSKTTLNFAAKRGFELVERDGLVEVFEAENDCEPIFLLRDEGGQFFWHGSIYLKEVVKQELPHWMKDETAVRRVLAFVAVELAA